MRIEILLHLFVLILLRSLPREPEVTKLSPTIIVNQNVGRLDVPMENVGGVQVVQRADNIVHYYLDVLLAEVELLVLRQHLAQVTLLTVHDNEEVLKRILSGGVDLREDHVINTRREAVRLLLREFPHNLYLAYYLPCVVPVLEAVLDGLNGNGHLGRNVHGLDHLAEGARAQLTHHLVVFTKFGPNLVKVHSPRHIGLLGFLRNWLLLVNSQ